MSRVPLVVGAIVVLGAAVALLVLLGGGEEPEAPTVASSTTPSPTTDRAVPPPVERNPSVTVTDVPRLPGESNRPSTGTHPREYAVGDVQVRDHRAGDNQPLDIPPNVHPAEGRHLPSKLTFAISQKVKAVLADCVAGLPREGRGEKPRMEGQVIVAIKDKQLSVTKSTIHLRDLEGPAVEAARQCVESKAIGLSTPAGDEADLESYSINLRQTLR